MFEHETGQQQHSLITPSVSPPSRSRSFSFNPPTNILVAGKRSSFGPGTRSVSRFSSTPLSTTDNPDIPTLRAQSTSRLLSVWSTLADRYSLRVDEDDIVDIRTGQVVKDRGVVRSLNGRWDFGRFSAAEDDDANDQPEDDEDEGRETEEAGNGLDSFAYLDHEQQAPTNPFLSLSNLASRATHAIDPTNDEDDAADLRAFMEAERLRKEAQGSVDELDDVSSGRLEEEELDLELVTDLDTDGFTTEGEPFSEYEVRAVAKGNVTEQVLEQPRVEKEYSDDELELWDDSDFDIISSSDKIPEISSTHSTPSKSKAVSHPHLLTPPNSFTYSQSYTDTVEPLVASPPMYSGTRSRSKPRPLSTKPPSTTPSNPPTPPPSSSIPSSGPFPNPSRIPRLDLSQLSIMKRGRSQSRSPSKAGQESTTGMATVADPEIPSSSRKLEPELRQSYSAASSSPTSKKLNRHSSEAAGISRSKFGQSGNNKGKSRVQVGEDESSYTAKARGNLNAVDVKGKGKAKEVIDIDNFSEHSPVDPPPSPIRKLSAKAKGKKRARSSGASWTSEGEYSARGLGGHDVVIQRERKLMGSPTKKGRYMDLSDTESESIPMRRSSPDSSSDIEFIDCDPLVSSPTKLFPRGGPHDVHHEHLRQDDPFRKTRRSQSGIEEDENDQYRENEPALPDSSYRSKSESRAPTHSQQDPPPDIDRIESGHNFVADDDPMFDPFASRHDRFYRPRVSVPAEDTDPKHSDLMLSPTKQPTHFQMHKAFEGRAKDIISNAIEGLYSLLTPEGMAALQGQMQDQQPPSSSHQHRISHSSPTRETNAMVYTPRRPSRHHPVSNASRSLASNAGSSYTTPTSHRDRSRQQLQSYPDPKFSRGTLPPSSPYSESDIGVEYGHGELDESDLEVDERPLLTTTSSSPKSSDRSSIRHRERSGPSNFTELPSPRSRASSIVHKSRSRGRRVSFKEIASQTQTKAGETRRTLSREISVEDPMQEMHQESRRVERYSTNLNHEVKVKTERRKENKSDEMRRREGSQSRRRRRSADTPSPSTGRKSTLRQRPPSKVRAPAEPKSPEQVKNGDAERRGPGRPKGIKNVGGRLSRN
ncbi:hypothetical protein DFJ43DRAFT_1226771 [Lentinula guzmanii]|uniref:Uncharacterized protein n=1 Tax=Lentinula guzmanii TaxID=2804957 RepID=A0AA38MRX7_9AGAR|nr:hypothetical protein DFJ43DRAFT_1226771 [Lentinula guzmanii]